MLVVQVKCSQFVANANGNIERDPTSRFSGGFDDRRPSILSLWLAPLILVVGQTDNSMSSISDKLRENLERREREYLLNNIDARMVQIMQLSEYYYSSRFEAIFISSPFPNYKDGRSITKDKYDVYLLNEYDQYADLLAGIECNNYNLAGDVNIYLGKGPIFKIAKSCDMSVNEMVKALTSTLNRRIVDQMIIGNSVEGIAIDLYSGHMITRPPSNGCEIVFDLIYYRSAQQVDSAEASTIAVPPSNLFGSPR